MEIQTMHGRTLVKLHYCEACSRFWYFNLEDVIYITVQENPLAPILCVGNDSICPACEFDDGIRED